MQNKRFLGFTFIFSAMIYVSFSAGAWVVGDWTRPNKSSIPEFKSQAELGTKCECVLDGGEWLETKSGSCCDEPDWYCSIEEEPTCTPEPSCCENEAYAKEHKKDCCAITEYANKNKSSCCEDEEFVKNNQSLCCEDETYANGHIEECCKDTESEGDKPTVCNCENDEYAKAFPEECSKCPAGGELGLDGVTCCDENGLAWDEEEQKYATVSMGACGCPYGGSNSLNDDVRSCQKDGLFWDGEDTGYTDTAFNETCKKVGGELSRNCSMCCQGNFAMTYFDTVEFNELHPKCCGCPDEEGVEVRSYYDYDNEKDVSLCCKDGKALNTETGAFDAENPICVCPSDEDGNYGEIGIDGVTCCSGVSAWNESSGAYDDVNISKCGCSDDLAEDGETCCSTWGLRRGPIAWHDSSDTYLRKPICGCPFNGEAGTDGETCCYNGKAWNYDFESEIYDKRYENLVHQTTGEEYYTLINPACACPGQGKTSADGTTCCDSIYAWNPNSGKSGAYDDRQPEKCGCPNGGKLKGDPDYNQTCCLHGFGISDDYSGEGLDQNFDLYLDYRSSHYNKLEPDVCGCPEGYTQVGDVCCSGAYMATGYVDESGAYYDSQEYRPDVCGCPEGGTNETNEYGEMVCCSNGYLWGPSEEEDSDGGEGYYSFRPDICKCPDGNESIWSDEADAYICCYDGLAWNEEKKSYNNAIPFCGCPWGSIDEETGNCCYDGLAWNEDDLDYNRVEPETCGCPWWGDISKVDGQTCCYDGHAWNGGDYYSGVYDDYRPELCGCPAGGTEKTDKDGNVVCCSGSNAFDPDVYAAGEGDNPYTDFKPEVCGCPEGGTMGEDGITCCSNGLAWNEESVDYDVLDIPNCGCPEGGIKTESGDTCCKDRKGWSEATQSYSAGIVSCECPIEYTYPDEGGVEGIIGHVGSDGQTCCLNGRAWDDESEYYGLFNRACGCPYGGVFSDNADYPNTCCQGEKSLYVGPGGNADGYFESHPACGGHCPPVPGSGGRPGIGKDFGLCCFMGRRFSAGEYWHEDERCGGL